MCGVYKEAIKVAESCRGLLGAIVEHCLSGNSCKEQGSWGIYKPSPVGHYRGLPPEALTPGHVWPAEREDSGGQREPSGKQMQISGGLGV